MQAFFKVRRIIPLFQVKHQIIILLQEFRLSISNIGRCTRGKQVATMGLFRRVCKGKHILSGAKGVIFLSDSHKVSFIVCLGEGTNNLVEWRDLEIILILVVEWGITCI